MVEMAMASITIFSFLFGDAEIGAVLEKEDEDV